MKRFNVWAKSLMASHDLNKVNAIVWFIQIAWWTLVVGTSSGRETCFFYPFKLSYHALNVCSSRNLYEQKRVKHLITVRERYAPTRITPGIRLLVKGIVYFTAPYSIATLIIVVAFNTTHSKYLTHVIGLSLAPWFTLLLARWKNSISPLDSRNINHMAANLKNWIDD